MIKYEGEHITLRSYSGRVSVRKTANGHCIVIMIPFVNKNSAKDASKYIFPTDEPESTELPTPDQLT